MSTVSSNTKGPVQGRSSLWKSNTFRGALVGLIPLGLLAGAVVLTLVITVLARQLVAASGFFAQQQAALITLIAGLVVAIVVYAVALWSILRRVAAWRHDGEQAQASAALWALGATALVVIVPVLLALLLPQHPAP
jgi:membrane protease YdiL (CAAX protease family)